MKINNTIHLTTQDQEVITLYRVGDNGDEICFLTHGTFSDKRVCLGLANYLKDKGLTCYILEWRGHNSFKAKEPFNFETVALYDFYTAFDYLCHQLNLKKIHTITHSGGGICMSMFLIRHPRFKNYIKSMTMVACQSFGAVFNYQSYFRILIFKYLNKIVGYIPAKKLKLGVINENYHTMQLWYDWNLSKKFISQIDGMDYAYHLGEISIPIYCICGSGDKVIAPTIGCYKFFELFNGDDKKFQEFGIENGSLEDYSHSRIMISKNAKVEVWENIASWINKYINN